MGQWEEGNCGNQMKASEKKGTIVWHISLVKNCLDYSLDDLISVNIYYFADVWQTEDLILLLKQSGTRRMNATNHKRFSKRQMGRLL